MKNSSLHGLRFAGVKCYLIPSPRFKTFGLYLSLQCHCHTRGLPSQPRILVWLCYGHQAGHSPRLSAIHLQCSKECWDWSQTYLKSNPTSSSNPAVYSRTSSCFISLSFYLSKFSVTEAASCPLISILLPFTVCVRAQLLSSVQLFAAPWTIAC